VDNREGDRAGMFLEAGMAPFAARVDAHGTMVSTTTPRRSLSQSMPSPVGVRDPHRRTRSTLHNDRLPEATVRDIASSVIGQCRRGP
jgi:hypothetical protein